MCVEIGPFHLLPGYPAGIPGRTLSVRREGSDLNTRGYLESAGNDVTGTRVPGYPGTRPFCGIPASLFLHNISRNPIQMSATKSTSTVQHVGGSDLNTRGYFGACG